MDKYLLQPLDVSEYIIQNDDTGRPYFGGGMYLRPRDMLKFGQLYLDKGTWKEKRIISTKWVEQSYEKYTVLENTEDQSEYGYLWWHQTYQMNDRKIAAVEARGAGGNIFTGIEYGDRDNIR